MKKKQLEKFLDINTHGEQLDQVMKEIIKEKFDDELKSKYSKILDNDLAVHRSSSKVKTIKRWSYFKIAGIVLLLLGVLLGAYFIMNSGEEKIDKVPQYLAQHQLLYQDITRNDTDVLSQSKSAAYLAFNDGDYSKYLSIISTESDVTAEDQFFIAYAEMMEQRYGEALQGFEAFSTDLQPGQKFYAEAQLYKAICLLKTDKDGFMEYYEGLESGDWVKGELGEMF